MSIITDKTSDAFRHRKAMKLNNSEVRNVQMNHWVVRTEYRLFGNLIATLDVDDFHHYMYLEINHCNWLTKTTKERLNWILHAFGFWSIVQRKWKWYYEDYLKSDLIPFEGKYGMEIDYYRFI
jgi:hypothetical protein